MSNKFQKQTASVAPDAEEKPPVTESTEVKEPVIQEGAEITEGTDQGGEPESSSPTAEELAAQEEAKKLEDERLAAEQLAREEEERKQAQAEETARLEAEQAEAKRLEEEQATQRRLAEEQAEAKRLADEKAAAETAALNAANSSVLTAGVSTNALDGGLPARAVSFRERLFAYMKEMAPGQAIDPVVGGRQQASFYSLVLAAFNDSDIKTFIACMEILKAAVAANRANDQVFSPRYALRFAANFAGGSDAMKSWTYLWTILHAVTSTDAKQQMRQIDWTVALGQLTDEKRTRVQQYFSERS